MDSQHTQYTLYSHETSVIFFFNDTATTEIYTLSLHDALPICAVALAAANLYWSSLVVIALAIGLALRALHFVIPGRAENTVRSEEHTSELQSRQYLVCRLLLEKQNVPCLTLRQPILPSLPPSS